jgi:hypothetical protein
VADADEDRAEQRVRFRVTHGRHGARRVADEHRLFVGAETLEVRQPHAGAGPHVVGKRVVHDLDAERRQIALDERQPAVGGRTAAVAVDEDDAGRGGHGMN